MLQELVQTYKPRNVPELIAAKTVEFWGGMKRLPTETIDTYFDRFQELLEDLADAEEPNSTKAAIRQFTLGPEFETYRITFASTISHRNGGRMIGQLFLLCVVISTILSNRL